MPNTPPRSLFRVELPVNVSSVYLFPMSVGSSNTFREVVCRRKKGKRHIELKAGDIIAWESSEGYSRRRLSTVGFWEVITEEDFVPLWQRKIENNVEDPVASLDDEWQEMVTRIPDRFIVAECRARRLKPMFNVRDLTSQELDEECRNRGLI